MKVLKYNKNNFAEILLIALFAFASTGMLYGQQKITFGVHADPVISWFTTDINQVRFDGARAGFNFGLTLNTYFTPNYSFSTGIGLIRAGGKLVSSDTTILKFTNMTATVLPGDPVVYKLQYLVFPVGLKLQTNQIGYVTYFCDLGMDPKIVISRKADIPSLNISDETASNELRVFNLSYHVTAGVEYSLGGTTALVFGLNFDNNFLDITKDNEHRPTDNVSHKMLSFRFGVNF